ncbi:hypothetical protein [Leptothoe sp. PORK10 BA2]|uniref:hypothetical protein n=1 Tax=Leptothoe sp. PORK10 BA2 TaxID=3110254 RepID=UPI002B1EC020|nr:hypothetical protein [Leptothoe sp. PORK10 BA2]
MNTEFVQIKIQAKEEEYKLLLEKYKQVNAQKLRTLDDVNQVTLNETVRQLEAQIESLLAELDSLRKPQQSSAQTYRQATHAWQENLHKINYVKVTSTINTVFGQLQRQEGSALFVLRNSRSMGGEWCIRKVKQRISSELGTLVAPCNISFAAHQTAGPVAFLNSLAERFPVDPVATPTSLTSTIERMIDRIFQSLVSGNILLIEINLYALNPQNSFLEWFVNTFWLALVSRLSSVSSQKRKIRLLAIVSVRGSIPRDCLPTTLCCKKTNFSGSKILELPLQKWTKDEICNWLFDFSGLTQQTDQLTDADIAQIAQTIHDSTDGVPKAVYDELMETMNQYAC